eukprot:TRINITY_DN41630_c0_g1_i1.p1 TRINITY_DN41630_c0_g1~~TRINITY_DN41630_c0_g1_i1.p1  ORF type:complete len:389 (+),score=74.29 TRINITY_DN41630_c0_g1_i1:78-1169(+)
MAAQGSAAGAAPRVCVFGDVLMDMVAQGVGELPAWGKDTVCAQIVMTPGGSAANCARHLAGLGLNVCFLSATGSDSVGAAFRARIDADPCPLERWASGERLATVPGPTGCCIVLSGAADRAFVTSYAQNEVWDPMGRPDSVAALLGRGGHTVPRLAFMGGYFQCAALHRPAFRAALSEARQQGTTVALDTQWDGSSQWGLREDGSNHILELLPLVDIFMPNEEELTMILRNAGGADAPAQAAASPRSPAAGAQLATRREHLLAAALRLGPSVVVLKLGPEGAAAADAQGGRWYCPAIPTAVADTTGAGDGFNAGFLSTWMATGGDVDAALRAGCRAGAAVVARLGACEQQLRPADVTPPAARL